LGNPALALIPFKGSLTLACGESGIRNGQGKPAGRTTPAVSGILLTGVQGSNTQHAHPWLSDEPTIDTLFQDERESKAVCLDLGSLDEQQQLFQTAEVALSALWAWAAGTGGLIPSSLRNPFNRSDQPRVISFS
jgi:hypothetical protein